jgi:regulator of protease activity HflC (stomatin/prohibitin superfamily)
MTCITLLKGDVIMRGDNDDSLQELLRNLDTSRIPRGAILIGLLVLIGIVIAWTTFYTVEADEVAVVQRFGRYVRREAPGLHSRTWFASQAAVYSDRAAV